MALANEAAQFARSQSLCEKLEKARAEFPEPYASYYDRMIAEVLKCNPQSASTRPDDQPEPPWEVIKRIRDANNRLHELLLDYLAADADRALRPPPPIVSPFFGQSITTWSNLS